MSMWEPFTERARRAIVLAQEEAQRLGNNYIGTEHILLGILSEGEGVAAKALESLGIDLARVRAEVEALVAGGGQTIQQEYVFTPRAKRVIELGFEEARMLKHNYIGTEHLLLGILRESEGVGARVLVNLGADSKNVREKTLALLGMEEPPPVPSRVTSVSSGMTQVFASSRPSRSSLDDALTLAARHALLAATQAAQDCRVPVCTAEHIIFGIAHVESSTASRLLVDRGATASAIRGRFSESPSGAHIDDAEIGFSSAAQLSIHQAIAEAHRLQRRQANAEHILLAIASDGDNVGAELLKTLGVDLGDLTKALETYLNGSDGNETR